jgi:hypothetical protein
MLATLRAGLENRFKPLVPDDIEQSQRRTFGLFGPALQLRDIPHGEIEVTGKHRLTQMRPFSQRADFIPANRLGSAKGPLSQMANWTAPLS